MNNKLFSLKSFLEDLTINKNKQKEDADKKIENDANKNNEDYSHLPKPNLNEIGKVVLELAKEFSQTGKPFSNLHIKNRLRQLEFFATQQSVSELMTELTQVGWLHNNNISIGLSDNKTHREYFLL